MTELEEIKEKLDRIFNARELFGENKKRANNLFREWVKLLHPDTGAEKEDTYYKKLIKLYDQYKEKGKPTKPEGSFSFRSSDKGYNIIEKVTKSHRTNLFLLKDEDGLEHYCFIASKAGDNLKDIIDYLTEVKKDKFNMYFPEIEAIVEIVQNDGNHTVIIIDYMGTEFLDLFDIGKRLNNQINGRDIAWIYRRLLLIIGITNDLGYTLNIKEEKDIYIEPFLHGVKIMNFDTIKKEKVTRNTDIEKVSKFFYNYCDDETPSEMKLFLLEQSRYTNETAFDCLIEFDKIIDKVYGKREFHEMII